MNIGVKGVFKTLDSDFIVSHEEYLWPVWQTYLGSAGFFLGFFLAKCTFQSFSA